ncbi:MAG: hypothetical protein K2W82_10235 [Candidatus Obscuribacterales bacterium]|nr:hypothetical protein [Candidatus Obscuribacterales bacterium]
MADGGFEGAPPRDKKLSEIDESKDEEKAGDWAPPVSELPKMDTAAAEALLPKVAITAQPGDAQPYATINRAITLSGSEVTLADGTYIRDSKERITEMISADGSRRRQFFYDNPNDPYLATREIINNKTTFKYLGPVRQDNGMPYLRNNYHVDNYEIYENGQLISNWSGIKHISPNGVYTVQANDSNAKLIHLGADNKELPEAVRQDRENNGIWTSRFTKTRPDGNEVAATYRNGKAESITITTYDHDASAVKTEWHKENNRWLSNQKPPQTLKDMYLESDGTLVTVGETDQIDKWTPDGYHHVETKSKNRFIYDDRLNLRSIMLPNGERAEFDYDSNSQLISMAYGKGNNLSQWTRQPNSDIWQNGPNSEIRRGIKINPDCSTEYFRGDGTRVCETINSSKLEYDRTDRLQRATLNSGSYRDFVYDGDKLREIKDVTRTESGYKQKDWQRMQNTEDFAYKDDNNAGMLTVRRQVKVDRQGDYTYKDNYGRDKLSPLRDLKRGEITDKPLPSRSFSEATEKFTALAENKGLRTERAEAYIKQLEQTTAFYRTDRNKLTATMDNFSEILFQADASLMYSPEQMNQIVETGLRNIAYPREIDQGNHPTCNVAIIEIYAACKNPDAYSNMLKQMAITSQFRTHNEQTVKPPIGALIPGSDEKKYNPDQGNVALRNLASQIVQMTLINGAYQLGLVERIDPQTNLAIVNNKNQFLYKDPFMPKSVYDLSGEDELIDHLGKTLGTPEIGPDLIKDDIVKASTILLDQPIPFFAGHEGATEIMQARAQGKLPMAVVTHNSNKTVQHVQTIHDAYLDTDGSCWILLDNQHGANNDRWVKVTKLSDL